MKLTRRGLLGKALALAGGAAAAATAGAVATKATPRGAPGWTMIGDGKPELVYTPAHATMLPPPIAMVGEAGPETLIAEFSASLLRQEPDTEARIREMLALPPSPYMALPASVRVSWPAMGDAE
jgi:hypothetical protein